MTRLDGQNTAPGQERLFEESYADSDFQHKVQQSDFQLNEIDIGDVTFAPGQSEPVHRWYRLTPSFSPGVVRFFLDRFDVSPRDVVFDPFSGRGTTVIECQRKGVPAIGAEINPLLREVGQRSLVWNRRAISRLQTFKIEVSKALAKWNGVELDRAVRDGKIVLPEIHNVLRWWRSHALRDLLVVRNLISRMNESLAKNYLWLAMNSASLDCANIHRNHPTITFDDDHDRDICVESEIHRRIDEICRDLERMSRAEIRNSGLNRVILGDTCENLRWLKQASGAPTCTITSPPYPNRFSYIHQTRPQLHFMELISGRAAATDIDLQTIGGTWGRATSNLAKELIEPPSDLRNALCYFDDLSRNSTLMCNYATKYFLDLNRHIQQLRRVVSTKYRGAYVVGNSRLSGVEVHTEIILSRLFENNGFTVDEIVLFRKRGGRKRLYETAVCVRPLHSSSC